MILLFKQCINQVIVTLAEKKLENTDIYLVEFISSQGNEKFYTIAQDTSDWQERYQRFCITHVTGDTTSGLTEVNMQLEGFYEYNIYENPDSLLIPDGLNLVETGRMKLIGFTEEKPVYNPTPSPAVKPVFDPKSYPSLK